MHGQTAESSTKCIISDLLHYIFPNPQEISNRVFFHNSENNGQEFRILNMLTIAFYI
jgi:hypothetical protein